MRDAPITSAESPAHRQDAIGPGPGDRRVGHCAARHGKRVRLQSTVDPVNAVEQEQEQPQTQTKTQGKAGCIALSLLPQVASGVWLLAG